MKKYKWTIILLNLVVLLIFFNLSMVKKEKILSDGKLILLELAPVDPRSLMQGDYMLLNYAISQNTFFNFIDGKYPKRGYFVVKLDNSGVASRVRIQAGHTPLAEDELLIEYNSGVWGSMSIGAESFFFQEGKGAQYEKAKYGGIKVDKHGNSILIGLYDEHRRAIK